MVGVVVVAVRKNKQFKIYFFLYILKTYIYVANFFKKVMDKMCSNVKFKKCLLVVVVVVVVVASEKENFNYFDFLKQKYISRRILNLTWEGSTFDAIRPVLQTQRESNSAPSFQLVRCKQG